MHIQQLLSNSTRKYRLSTDNIDYQLLTISPFVLKLKPIFDFKMAAASKLDEPVYGAFDHSVTRVSQNADR